MSTRECIIIKQHTITCPTMFPSLSKSSASILVFPSLPLHGALSKAFLLVYTYKTNLVTNVYIDLRNRWGQIGTNISQIALLYRPRICVRTDLLFN